MGEKCEACGGDVINDVCQQCGTSYAVTKLLSRVVMLEEAIEGWRTECATLRRERDEARARIRTMRNALNGLIYRSFPFLLLQHEAEWRDAVLEAEEAAKPVAGDLWGTCCKCGAAVEYVGPESVACTNKACELAASAAKEGE